MSYTATVIPGNETCTVPNSGPSGDMCTVAGLQDGVSYVVKVTATNAIGTSAPSPATPKVMPHRITPSIPLSVQAVAGNASAVVSWLPPSVTGSSPLVSYTVTSSPASAGCTVSATLNPTPSCTVVGLTNGLTYSFRVMASSAAGPSPLSVPSIPVRPSTVPSPPTGVVAAPRQNALAVSWILTPTSQDGGWVVTSYTATAEPGGATCTVPQTSGCLLGGLTDGVAYTVTVTATNLEGISAPSAPSTAAIPESPPSAPSGVSVVGGNAQVSVSWTPATTTGAPITGYLVTSIPQGHTCSTTGTSCTVTGLTNGLGYRFSVVAQSVAGPGPAAGSASVVPVTTPSAPSRVTATAGDSAIVVAWALPPSNGGRPITSYTATAQPGGATCTTTVTTCRLTGLIDGTSYTVRVTATNAVGIGPSSSPSAPAVPATTPGPPNSVVALPHGRSAVVSWVPPVLNGGDPITSYVFTASPGGSRCTYLVATPETDTCTVTGLQDGTSYSFSVTAISPAGTSLPSASSSQVIPLDTPSAPTGVVATAAAEQATVSWTPSIDDGGSAITSYTVTASPGSQSCTYLVATPETDTCIVTGLADGTSYTFTVAATNAAGAGAPSTPSSSVTPVTTPGDPTDPVATPAPESATVSWIPPRDDGGSPITSYLVTASPGGSSCTYVVSSPEDDSCTVTVTGLQDGTAYTFDVIATSGVGETPGADTSPPVTPEATPSAPTGVVATAGAEQATVS